MLKIKKNPLEVNIHYKDEEPGCIAKVKFIKDIINIKLVLIHQQFALFLGLYPLSYIHLSLSILLFVYQFSMNYNLFFEVI